MYNMWQKGDSQLSAMYKMQAMDSKLKKKVWCGVPSVAKFFVSSKCEKATNDATEN